MDTPGGPEDGLAALSGRSAGFLLGLPAPATSVVEAAP